MCAIWILFLYGNIGVLANTDVTEQSNTVKHDPYNVKINIKEKFKNEFQNERRIKIPCGIRSTAGRVLVTLHMFCCWMSVNWCGWTRNRCLRNHIAASIYMYVYFYWQFHININMTEVIVLPTHKQSRIHVCIQFGYVSYKTLVKGSTWRDKECVDP